MSTATASFDPRTVGYRRIIIGVGIAWAGVAALLPFGRVVGATPTQTAMVLAIIATGILGGLFRLDADALAQHDVRIRDAWAYALLIPFCLVAWLTLVPALFGGLSQPALPAVAGLLTGPPVSVMVYAWQRGERVSEA
jgi:hypothetical protein